MPGMADQRADERPVPVEAGVRAHDGHHPVADRQLGQVVQVLHREPGGELPEPHAGAQLRPERRPPRLLVAREARGGEVAPLEGLLHRRGGPAGAQETVVDPAAGRRLDEPRRVPDRQDPIPVRPGQRPQRERAGHDRVRIAGDPAGGAERADQARQGGPGMGRRHDADLGPRGAVAAERHQPPEPRRRHVGEGEHLERLSRPDGGLPLRADHGQGRQSPPEPPLEPIARAAGEDAEGRRVAARPVGRQGLELDLVGADGERDDARPGDHLRPGPGGGRGEPLVEGAAGDDAGLARRAVVGHGQAARRVEPCGGGLTQDRVPRHAGQPERLGAHDAGAVDREPDRRVLLEHPDPEPVAREPLGRIQAGGAAADHEDVGAPRHTLRPRRSQRPRKVIQNDRVMSRTSSQKLCLRTYSRSYRNFWRGGTSRSA